MYSYCGLLFAMVAWAQSPHGFDVVSIKPNTSGSHSVTMGAKNWRATATNVTLRTLILAAYRLQDYQLSGGPAWIGSDRFDVAAKTDDTKVRDEDLWMLLQPALEERFRLKVRRETRQLPVYLLEVAKPGAKGLAANRTTEETSIQVHVEGENVVLDAKNVRMGKLADRLSSFTSRKILDNTGLQKGFDFRLEWARDISGEDVFEAVREGLGMSGPSLQTVLKDRLGLRLQPGKGPVETIVIESAQPVTPN